MCSDISFISQYAEELSHDTECDEYKAIQKHLQGDWMDDWQDSIWNIELMDRGMQHV